MTLHKLKCWPEFFDAMVNGVKTHDVRVDDRQYNLGDTLRCFEYDPAVELATGREADFVVTYIARGSSCPGLHDVPENIVVMSVRLVAPQDAEGTG